MCEPEVLGSFGGFFKRDIVVSHFNVSWKNWLAIYFNYFTGTHMTIFERHFLITHCLVFWSFFPQQNRVFKVRFRLFSFYFRIKIQKFYY